jgi:hypothetical protein
MIVIINSPGSEWILAQRWIYCVVSDQIQSLSVFEITLMKKPANKNERTFISYFIHDISVLYCLVVVLKALCWLTYIIWIYMNYFFVVMKLSQSKACDEAKKDEIRRRREKLQNCILIIKRERNFPYNFWIYQKDYMK